MTKSRKYIHLDFAYQVEIEKLTIKSNEKEMAFTYNQTKEWVNLVMKSSDANFRAYLRDRKKLEILKNPAPNKLAVAKQNSKWIWKLIKIIIFLKLFYHSWFIIYSSSKE